MKPFVLQRALNGAPLVAMPGNIPVTDFSDFPELPEFKNAAVVHFPGGLRLKRFDDTGKMDMGRGDNQSKEFQLWIDENNYAYVNVYRRTADNTFYFGAYHRGADAFDTMTAEKAAPPPEAGSSWRTTLVGDPQGDPIGLGGI